MVPEGWTHYPDVRAATSHHMPTVTGLLRIEINYMQLGFYVATKAPFKEEVLI